MKIVKMVDNDLVTYCLHSEKVPVALDGCYVDRYMAVVDLVTNISPRGLPQRNRISTVQCEYNHFIEKL